MKSLAAFVGLLLVAFITFTVSHGMLMQKINVLENNQIQLLDRQSEILRRLNGQQ